MLTSNLVIRFKYKYLHNNYSNFFSLMSPQTSYHFHMGSIPSSHQALSSKMHYFSRVEKYYIYQCDKPLIHLSLHFN